MTQLALLYASLDAANAAAADLRREGFPDAEVIAGQTAAPVLASLRKAGFGPIRTKAYADAIGEGKALLLIDPNFGQGYLVEAALAKHAAIPVGYPENDPHPVEPGVGRAAPLSVTFGWPVLLSDPTPLSTWLKWRVLKVDATPSRTLEKVRHQSADAAPLSRKAGWRVLSDEPAPLSRKRGWRLLWDRATPLSDRAGWPVLRDDAAPLSDRFGWRVLLNDPTPLSTLLGWRVLSSKQ